MNTITSARKPDAAARSDKALLPYFLLFFLSGFPALLYQIVWERALFTLYGTDIESVTIIVTVFMLGLGIGSLGGGWLSARPGVRHLKAFGLIELSTGVFGLISLGIFHRVAFFTAGASIWATGLIAFFLLLLPTVLMGSTLPLLVEHFVRRTRRVGESVGALYSVNTLGSAVACLFAALFIMRTLGESGSVRLAAAINFTVGVAALWLFARTGQGAEPAVRKATVAGHGTIPFWIGMLLAGGVGFIALAYEIVWYRLYSFTSGGTPECFALMLAFYLFGIAYGSLSVRDFCRRHGDDLGATLRAAANIVVLGTVAAFLLGPALSWSVLFVRYELTLVLVFIGAALLGAAFPLLSQAAIGPEQQAGSRLGLLYLSNILGSTMGSFLVGFVVLDHWSTRATSMLLLALGAAVACVLAALARGSGRKRMFAAGCVACVVVALCSGPLFSGLYERLLFKRDYRPGKRFSELVENRSGVIAVDANDVVYGGGAYDGRFSTDLVNDTNGLFRAFAVGGLHPRPAQLLEIGLSSGSWAQVLVNEPEVEKETIVEINPGYLPLIRDHGDVASLLQNPKVHIVIDDGRRWLVGHPDQKFDFILMNTTFHWRANSSNLLSEEFLRLARAHLKPGGIFFYNTTWSDEAQATGASVFPYAMRISNFMAVSDRPFTLDKARWRKVLAAYRIDGRPVFDLADVKQRQRLEEVLSMADEGSPMVESRASILSRLKGERLITDNNMGGEWEKK